MFCENILSKIYLLWSNLQSVNPEVPDTVVEMSITFLLEVGLLQLHGRPTCTFP